MELESVKKTAVFAFCWHCLQSQCYLDRGRREVAIITVLADDWAMGTNKVKRCAARKKIYCILGWECCCVWVSVKVFPKGSTAF